MDEAHIKKIREAAIQKVREQQLTAALTLICNQQGDIAMLRAENELLTKRLQATLAKLQADKPAEHANGEDKSASAPCPAC